MPTGPNRTWVFSSKASGWRAVLRECGSLFAARVPSRLMDWGIMVAKVNLMVCKDLIVKLLSSILWSSATMT